MLPNRPVSRTAVFIDSAYLARVFESVLPGARPDYRELQAVLGRAPGVHTIFFYGAHPYVSPVPTELELLRRDRLERIFGSIGELPRFELRLGNTERCADPECPTPLHCRPRVVAMLALDLFCLALGGEISRAIVFSGDADLARAVEDARDEGVAVHLFHGRGPCRPGDELFLASDECTAIERRFVERFMLRPS